MVFNFQIQPGKIISDNFIINGVSTFVEAQQYIRKLPYKRNQHKDNKEAVFLEHCGTCSTKHAVLKRLAEENRCSKVALYLGIFKMHKKNTPEIATVLDNKKIQYIPEAHNYLRIKGDIVDCTSPTSHAKNFSDDLLQEIEITPDQITKFKVQYHRDFLVNWLELDGALKLSLEELWIIREECIYALQKKGH
jgi:hypothetical protein